MFWEGPSCKLNQEISLFLIILSSWTLEQVFGSEIKGIWQYVLLVNGIHINELDVRLLNFSIRTPVDKAMVFLL